MGSINLTKTHDVIGSYKQIDFSDIRKKYTDPGTEYAFKVLDGDILAGYHVKTHGGLSITMIQMKSKRFLPLLVLVQKLNRKLNNRLS